MKARVKATGEIVEVEPTFIDGNKIYSWVTDNGYFYTTGSLDFESLTKKSNDVKEKSLPKDEPDYWEKLKHQYAGMAIQGILSNPEQIALYDIDCVEQAVRLADLLINKLKEDSQCEK